MHAAARQLQELAQPRPVDHGLGGLPPAPSRHRSGGRPAPGRTAEEPSCKIAREVTQRLRQESAHFRASRLLLAREAAPKNPNLPLGRAQPSSTPSWTAQTQAKWRALTERIHGAGRERPSIVYFAAHGEPDSRTTLILDCCQTSEPDFSLLSIDDFGHGSDYRSQFESGLYLLEIEHEHSDRKQSHPSTKLVRALFSGETDPRSSRLTLTLDESKTLTTGYNSPWWARQRMARVRRYRRIISSAANRLAASPVLVPESGWIHFQTEGNPSMDTSFKKTSRECSALALLQHTEEFRKQNLQSGHALSSLMRSLDRNAWRVFRLAVQGQSIKQLTKVLGLQECESRTLLQRAWDTMEAIQKKDNLAFEMIILMQSCARAPAFQQLLQQEQLERAAMRGLKSSLRAALTRSSKSTAEGVQAV